MYGEHMPGEGCITFMARKLVLQRQLSSQLPYNFQQIQERMWHQLPVRTSL